ncbi:trypsin-7-like [Papilio machaon]|uniref:trypsin-7-like n=1 Tax=Papilio machaon TaxID=76193 RepID=UPI001E663662|nr:trypsin-7-like [Papilio machaon]
MYYLYFAFVSIICTLVPVETSQYDLIVIPIPKVTSKLKKLLDYNSVRRPRNKNRKELYRNGDDFFKLDVEDYHAPTDIPDIDNFEFSGNRDGTKPDYDMGMSYGDDKIVGGAEVDIDLYPYHAAYGTNCGGAIIDKKWVITAGHCGIKSYIRVGSKYLNKGRKVQVKHNYIHPLWSAKNKDHPFDYDFQLLELDEHLKFDENVQPIKIGRIEDMVVGKLVAVSGWGNTEENGPYAPTLRAVRVPIISKDQCQSVPFPYFRGSLTPRMFCAGFPEGKMDACQGDSGGPAVSNERLLGMVSFGYGCATPGSYGVYSKVAKVRSWIEDVTGLRLD